MEFDKSRVYTALNADELKVGDKVYVADSLSDLKRLVEMNMSDCERKLKAIRKEYENFRFFVKTPNLKVGYNLAYLVERAKEKKWRPYKDTDEMIADYKKRFNVDGSDYELPLIWINHKEWPSSKYLITGFNEFTIIVSYVEKELTTFFDKYTYLDGSPCGMEE